MRLYLEAIETLPPEELREPELIRIDVTDKDWRIELQALKGILDPGKRYFICLHYCRHGEGKPCTTEVVEG